MSHDGPVSNETGPFRFGNDAGAKHGRALPLRFADPLCMARKTRAFALEGIAGRFGAGLF